MTKLKERRRRRRTEVVVEVDSLRRTRSRGIMASRAAVTRVLLVAVEVGFAGGAAAGAVGALELRGAVGVQVDGTFGCLAIGAGVDADRDVEAVDEGHYQRRNDELYLVLTSMDRVNSPSYQSKLSDADSVHSATVAGGTPVPLFLSHSRPPLQPPEEHISGGAAMEKSQSVRPQIRPAVQLSGTLKEVLWPGGASHLR